MTEVFPTLSAVPRPPQFKTGRQFPTTRTPAVDIRTEVTKIEDIAKPESEHDEPKYKMMVHQS